MVQLSLRDRFKTALDLRADINKTLPQPISVSTVKTILQTNGLSGRVAVKKPLLCKVNKQKRLQFAKKYKNWTVEQWKLQKIDERLPRICQARIKSKGGHFDEKRLI